MKKTAHCIHHTHWDLIWYFTAQDATVQLCYNMKEMLEGFRSGRITDFFFDGQSAPMDEYRKLHPEDEAYIRTLVTEKKLVICRIPLDIPGIFPRYFISLELRILS